MDIPGHGLAKRRAIALMLAVIVLFFVYLARLFQVQIVDGADYAAQMSQDKQLKVTTTAARGEIYDRYMRPLNINIENFSITLNFAFFPKGNDNRQKANGILLSLIKLMTAAGAEWSDTLPISKTQPFKFLPDRDKSISSMKSKLNLADYSTAEHCVAKLVSMYSLEEYTPEQQRTVGGVLYEMLIRKFSAQNPFTFCSRVPDSVRTIILENSLQYPGVEITPAPVREYVGGETAPHLLGTIGPIFEEQYEELSKQGYKFNDLVGKNGVESAFESALRGQDGTTLIRYSPNGTILEKTETVQSIAGSSVILTLDSKLQLKAQDELDKMITMLRTTKKKGSGGDAKSGSVVMLDMTGGVLTCATWPNYDLSTYYTNYSELISNADKPLFNRALGGAYPCGSVMKPGVALAALTEGTISPSTVPYVCRRSYSYYKNSTFGCLGYHGSASCVKAIRESCNVYFYEVGRLLGINKMVTYSTAFGLGQKTGIEVGESVGMLASPDNNRAKNIAWNPADVSLAAIGQSTNAFTPLQLATYAMTIANNGVRYKTHLEKSTRTYDGVETPYKPVVESTIKFSGTAINTVLEGMIGVTTQSGGSARSVFAGAKYVCAGKTGTAQTVRSSSVSDHSVFIGYAPADDPEVAIAVLVENGKTSPAPAAVIARNMLDAYFESKTAGSAPTQEGVLLP